jgi:hypothetical protein
MASFAVLLVAMVSVMLLSLMFYQNYAVYVTSQAFDSFRSQLVEKNGLAQIVKESVLAIRETAVTNSGSSLQTEINNRLGSMTFSSGVAVTLNTPVASVPAHTFYPAGTAPVATNASYFSVSPRGVSGMGNLLSSIVMLGPVADLGRVTATFNRTVSGSAAETRTYTVNADLWSVPLTNVNMVAYGLPASGQTPAAAPTLASGFFSAGVSRLVCTSNNPSNDSTAYPDLYVPNTPEQLPYQFRNAVSFSWNAYEYVWSSNYQNALLSAAGSGNTFDFSSGSNPAIPGVAYSAGTVTITLASVTSQTLAVVDSLGGGNVVINGSGTSGSAFVLLLRNTAGGAGKTNVTFSGNNSRPVLILSENCALSFSGSPQFQGGLLVDPNCTVTGTVTWFGHISFYALASPFPTFNLTLADSATVKAALAPLSPRILLVSATATR